MNEQRVARPTGITVTAWVWIGGGVLMLLSAAMAGLSYSMSVHMGPPDAKGFPPEFALMNLLFRNFAVLIVLQCVVALVAIWAGVDLLRLKAWARSAVEVLSWLGLVWTVGFGAYWVYMWLSMTGQAPAGADMFQMMGAAMGVVVTFAFAVPLVIMIRYLRGHEARQAVLRSASA